jgi:hypothetical protein
MTNVEKIAHDVRLLSEQELASFRVWFREFEAESWDRKLETDATSGRLNALADAALADHAVD